MTEKLPEGWKRVKLGEVCKDISYGYTASAKSNPLGTKFLRITDIVSKRINWESVPYCEIDEKDIKKYRLEVGDIVIARTGATTGYNKIIKNNVNSVFASYLIRYRINREISSPFFVWYNLQSSNWNRFVVNIIGGSAQPGVNAKQFASYEFLLPLLPEQKAIASVLSSIDDKIDLLHRQNQTLEKIAETLFRKWFIEDAKDDWEEVKLKDIYIFEKGFEPGSKNYLEEREHNTIRFIRVGDLLDATGNTFIKKDIAKILCKKEDLLISFDGTVGRINFGLEGSFSSGIRKIYSKNPIFDNLGLKYLIFKSKDIQDLINAHSSGTVILHASSSIDYLNFSFPKDENYIKKFNELITPLFDKILKNKSQICRLESLRDTLLPKLISGELRVKC